MCILSNRRRQSQYSRGSRPERGNARSSSTQRHNSSRLSDTGTARRQSSSRFSENRSARNNSRPLDSRPSGRQSYGNREGYHAGRSSQPSNFHKSNDVYVGEGSAWSKGAYKADRGIISKILAIPAAIIAFIAGLFRRLLPSKNRGAYPASHYGAGSGTSFLQSPVFRVLGVLIVVLLLFCAVDGIASHGKIHGHVVVGEVKAKGMTEEELAKTLEETYGTRMAASGVTIYASEEAMEEHAQNPEDTGDLSVEEQAKQTVCWSTDSSSLQAYIDYDGLAHEAFQAGRGNILNRLCLLVFKKKIPVEINYNEKAVESLASSVQLSSP